MSLSSKLSQCKLMLRNFVQGALNTCNKSTWSLPNSWIGKKIEPYPDIKMMLEDKSIEEEKNPALAACSYKNADSNVSPYLMCWNEGWERDLRNSKVETNQNSCKREKEESKLDSCKSIYDILSDYKKLQTAPRLDDVHYKSKRNQQNTWIERQLVQKRNFCWDFVNTDNLLKLINAKPDPVKTEKLTETASAYDSQKMQNLLKSNVKCVPFTMKTKEKSMDSKIPIPCCPKTIKYIACRKCTRTSNHNSKREICPTPSFSECWGMRWLPTTTKDLRRRKTDDYGLCDTTKHLAIKDRFKLPPPYSPRYVWDISKLRERKIQAY
uniref:Uncharacterized protein n=1 Tax=Glossina palpalis gambiensis TaxID=67801 RepID=A0A1B0BS57_9MUSC